MILDRTLNLAAIMRPTNGIWETTDMSHMICHNDMSTGPKFHKIK